MVPRRAAKNKGSRPKKPPRQKELLLGSPPYGFRLQLAPVPRELTIVRRIFACHDEGLSLREIASLLDDDRVPTKKSAGKWSAEAINVILHRRTLYRPHLGG